MHPGTGSNCTEEGGLTVLMRQGAACQTGANPHRRLIAQDERQECLAAAAAHRFTNGQYRRNNLDSALTGDIAMAFTQLDRAASRAIEQRRSARIAARPAACQH